MESLLGADLAMWLDIKLMQMPPQLAIGIVNGAFYAMLSLGLAVIFGLLNIINFTHGAQFMMGAFVAWMLLSLGSSEAARIGLANAGQDTTNCIKQIAEFGLTRRGTKVAALLMFIADVNALGLEVAQGLVMTESFYWDLNDRTRAFTARVRPRLQIVEPQDGVARHARGDERNRSRSHHPEPSHGWD